MPKFQHRLCQRRTRHLQMPQSSKCISLRSFKPKIIEYYMVPPAYLMLALASALTLSFGYAMPHFDLRHQWMQPQVGETAMLRDARATVWRRKLDIFQTIITSLYTRQSILTEYSTSKTKKTWNFASVVSRGSCAWTTLVLSNHFPNASKRKWLLRTS